MLNGTITACPAAYGRASIYQREYHWWHQTDTGQWAEKMGEMDSHLISGTNGSTNPGASVWKGSVNYVSACKYYAIDMH